MAEPVGAALDSKCLGRGVRVPLEASGNPCRPLLGGLILVCALAGPALAQTVSNATTREITSGGKVIASELRGEVALQVAGAPVPKRFVLRCPRTWNGVLVIGAHGGSGGNNYSPDGRVIGTDETALDDVVGTSVVEQGFAYASVDRDGLGGTREGLDLTYQFTSFADRQVTATTGRPPTRRYLVGLSMGGAIGRYAAEDDTRRFDGVLLIAGGAGDLPTRLDRLAELARLWPSVDPRRSPGLADDHPQVQAYARVIGTPAAARRLWPFTSQGATAPALRSALEPLGLTGLSDGDVASFTVAAHGSTQPFATRLADENTKGRPLLPTIEIVGTWDDLVIREVLAYRQKVRQAGADARYRLYQVEGVWHMSSDDDGVQSFQYVAGRMGLDPDVAKAMGEGPSYLPAVRQAFDLLHRWVTAGTTPPPDQTVAPGTPIR